MLYREKVDDGSDHAVKGYDNHGSVNNRNDSGELSGNVTYHESKKVGNRLRFLSCCCANEKFSCLRFLSSCCGTGSPFGI